MSTLSPEKARGVIADIRIENGGITPEDREKTPPSVLRTVESLRRKVAAATRTLATNLYSRDTRFIYELIQNAEDNEYLQAARNKEEPYVSFTLYPDRLVIDSNEDGFTEANVRAICSTGESTKTNVSGYIGEKGIGFKSVFKVAKKVNIQSGPFSFYFEHTRGVDDGLGMVIPLDAEFYELPPGVRTRLTLTLIKATDFNSRCDDLSNIPDTFLLFFSKLKQLTVKINPAQGPTKTIVHKLVESQRTCIRKTITVGQNSRVEEQFFHVFTKPVSNLPDDESRPSNKEATIVLAFPVDQSDKPILEEQYTYAFLPLRKTGFTFLIQSDFVTQASREDVFDSARNRSLLTHVAELFNDAVVKFCQHPSQYPTLQYDWIKWLRSLSVPDQFWRLLGPNIKSLLKETPILRSKSGRSLHYPKDLCTVPIVYRDKDGNPLFADLEPELYLSDKYDWLILSKELDVGVISIVQLLERIEADLESADSRLKSKGYDQDWHRRVAEFLVEQLSKWRKHPQIGPYRKRLRLIPLQSGLWVSESANPIYFQSSGPVTIPTDLGLRLVEPSAATNSARAALYRELGVKNCNMSTVLPLICQRYRRSGLFGEPSLTLEHSVSHLNYLYWHSTGDDPKVDSTIWLFDHKKREVQRSGPFQKYVFFEDEHDQYSPKTFLATVEVDGRTYTIDASFIHPQYIASQPEKRPGRMSFVEWLEDSVGVQRNVPLLKIGHVDSISDEFDFVKWHGSEKVMGLLKKNWQQYGPQVWHVDNELRYMPVNTEDGEICLNESYLPLPTLKSKIRTWQIQRFPFLRLPVELTEDNLDQWKFLAELGVNVSDDLDFHLKALDSIAKGNPNGCNSAGEKAVAEIYTAIQNNCVHRDERNKIRKCFQEEKLIYLPSELSNCTHWTCRADCVWSAEEWFDVKYNLTRAPLYRKLGSDFQSLLNLKTASWKDYLDQIEKFKGSGSCSQETILAIYRRLEQDFRGDESHEVLRMEFEDRQLVRFPTKNSWHSPSTCLWADSEIQIHGKVCIAELYVSLEDFFTRMLLISKPAVSTYVSELQNLSGNSSRLDDIKALMRHINSMRPEWSDIAILRSCSIFPVKTSTGVQSLANSQADFAIIDRQEYAEAFSKTVISLAFTLREIRDCDRFLQAMGLGHKYVSVSVEERTRVHGGTFNQDITTSFQQKAYALYRCGVHYHSPKCRDEERLLYQSLQNASIYMSDGITKSITLVQYGKECTVECNKANLHFEEISGQLNVYVPRRKHDRQVCFSRQLPKKLLCHMSIEDNRAEPVVLGILQNESLSVVDEILKDAGIVEVEGVERPVDYSSEEESGYESGTQTPISTPRTERSAAATLDRRMQSSSSVAASATYQRSSSVAISSRPTYRPTEAASQPRAVPAPLSEVVVQQDTAAISPSPRRESPSPRPSEPVPCPNAYVTILDHMIQVGKRCEVPDRGQDILFNLEDMGMWDANSSNLGSEAGFNMRSMERDFKVGAAGELLVFEMLKKQKLFTFGIHNWRSTIREKVRVHPDYAIFDPWNGSKIANLSYPDIGGDLTSLLVSKGYLDGATWQSQRPHYYIEVKTTTGSCNEPFYMSGERYAPMQSYRLQPGQPSKGIYILARVFGIASKMVGLRFYLDPETARRNGELQFTADTWKVSATRT